MSLTDNVCVSAGWSFPSVVSFQVPPLVTLTNVDMFFPVQEDKTGGLVGYFPILLLMCAL